MEAKESNVEAWTAVLLIDVNDYLPRDDLPFLLLCSLASSQHAKPEVVEWAPPDLFLSFFCWLFMWCTSATHLQREICKTLPDSPIADLLKDSSRRAILLRNTLRKLRNGCITSFDTLLVVFFNPISQTMTLYGTSIHAIVFPHETWFIVHIMGIIVISSTIIIIIVD